MNIITFQETLFVDALAVNWMEKWSKSNEMLVDGSKSFVKCAATTELINWYAKQTSFILVYLICTAILADYSVYILLVSTLDV